MALADITHAPTGFSLTAPFRAIGRFLVMVAESTEMMRQVEKLNNTSDQELAARGVTRHDVVREIFASRYYI